MVVGIIKSFLEYKFLFFNLSFFLFNSLLVFLIIFLYKKLIILIILSFFLFFVVFIIFLSVRVFEEGIFIYFLLENFMWICKLVYIFILLDFVFVNIYL